MPVLSSVQVKSQSSVNGQQRTNKELITDLKHEIVALKAEITRINDNLSLPTNQVGHDNGHSNTVTANLTAEEILSIDATKDEYEMKNAMHQANAVEKIEDYFVQQAHDIAKDDQTEIAIKKSLDLDQNEMASIVDLQCKSSLCRLELNYDLAVIDEDLQEGGHSGVSTIISNLMDAAVSHEINEVDQTGIAVIYLGQSEANLPLDIISEDQVHEYP